MKRMTMKRKNERRRNLSLILSLTLVCVMALGGGTLLGALSTGQRASAEPDASAIVEPAADSSPAIYVSAKNAKSVVGVLTSEQQWNRSTNQVQSTPVAQGSGVVIREGGYVLTNYHVIEDGSAFQILMPSGEKVDAQVVGTDSSTDLAVLRVLDKADELVPVSVGSANALTVGSTVIAIGNPGGEVLANTVTQGIVSALERTSVNSSNTTRRINYIQHDAAINSGNSGGGLFNYKGELVGINTLKYGGSAYSSVTFEGLGFAIPVDTAYDIATQLIDNGKVLRPALGVTVMSNEGPDVPMNNAAPASVAIMSVTENGAAAKAGLKQYDFIYEVDGQRVTSLLDLTGILDSHEVGDTVSVTVVRYNQAGMVQRSMGSSLFGGFGYGYGYGYGYGNDGSSAGNGELMVSGGYEMVTVDVTLEVLEG